MTFSKRLKEARQKAGLTQAELAKKAGTTSATVSSYESAGTIKKASLDLAMNFANALNVSLDWLCGIDGQTKNANNVTDFSAKDYLYSLVRVISEMSCEVDDSIYGGEKALSIVITKYPLIAFLEKIKDLIKVYQNGTLTEDLYETCVEKVINDYSDYVYAYSNFMKDFEADDAEQTIIDLCFGNDSKIQAGVLIQPSLASSLFDNDQTMKLFITEKEAKYLNEKKKAKTPAPTNSKQA